VFGTTATVVVADARVLGAARVIVERETAVIDRACSRFRDDSDLARVNRARGRAVPVGRDLIGALAVARRAARATGGLVDPTVGRALRVLGYDRDFDDVARDGAPLRVRAERVPGWEAIELDHDRATVRVPTGVELDLGATAKAWCADRAANAAYGATGVAVLVALGGDIAVAGPVPAGGWPVRVADDHTATEGGQTIALHDGGLATSGTARRYWRRGDRRLHHLIDPATGTPASERWRTVSVAAASCVAANVASTAAMVLGEHAPEWLGARRLPSRLVAPDGTVVTVAGWPADAQVAVAG
jgi:thiamine biosynthesis lipoprotein